MLKLFDPIFQKNYYFLYTKTYQEYKDILKNEFNKDTELDEECFGETEMVKKDGVTGVLIWVKKTNNNYNDNNSIGHEIHHAVVDMLEYCGIEQCEATDEVYAYVCGWLTAEIIQHINKLEFENWYKI